MVRRRKASRKRLNPYQRHMKSCLRKSKSKRGSQQNKFKACARSYRKRR